MTAHRDRRPHDTQAKHVQTQAKAIKAQEVAKVYKALGLDTEEGRRPYLDWYEADRLEPRPSFEIVERGDTLTFE